MSDWFRNFLATGIENKASEWQLLLDKPALVRIDGKPVEITDLTLDKAGFDSFAVEYLTEKQKTFYDNLPQDDFVNEDFLIEEADYGRFVAHLQKQRGQLELVIRRPLRDKSMFFDILSYAVKMGASDIHVRQDKYARVRKDSKLQDTDFMTDTVFLEKAIPEILPNVSNKAVYDETGDFDFAWEEEGIGRFRVNLHRQRGKAALSFRYVKSKAPTVKEANLPEVLKSVASKRNGIIFVAGTTGSGKSTTMAAMLDHINNTRVEHIITIEDPIEYTFQDNLSFFEQREVGLDAESFDSALVHALRQDPDIIMVGEMRNRTTFETALTAADTGHLVISTVHAKNASQAITRILEMFPPEQRESTRKSLAENLQAIICQRLAPLESGKGVVPVVEILINTPVVKKLLYDDKLDKISQAIETGGEDNMTTFNKSLMALVNDKRISKDVAMKLSDNPQQLKMNLQGIFLSSGGIIN